MRYIKKVIKEITGIELNSWDDFSDFKVKFTGSLEMFIKSHCDSPQFKHLKFKRFQKEMAWNQNALIYELSGDYDRPITSIDYSFPAHQKQDKYVYQKGEKIQTDYRDKDEGRLYVRKIRTYTYNQNLVPIRLNLKTQWFDNQENIVFENEIQNITFDTHEMTKRRYKRLDRLFRDGITMLANNGITNQQLFFLNQLLSNEVDLFREGAPEVFLQKIKSENIISQTPFLTESLRNKLVEDLTITV